MFSLTNTWLATMTSLLSFMVNSALVNRAWFACNGYVVWENKKLSPRPRRPVTVTTQETIATIHDNIMAHSPVTEHYTATELGISQDRILAVIHNELPMSKVSARCVPKLLGHDLKRTRLNILRTNFVIFYGGSQKISSEICDYGWDLGPSLPIINEATIEAVET